MAAVSPDARRTLADATAQWAVSTRLLGASPDALVEAVETPARTVVGGLVGVGKTTLVNRWLGTAHPTGLGGVTREVAWFHTEGAEVADTPGLDRPEEALVRMQPLLAEADALVWVVDGLQPLTESERRVIEQASPPELPLTVLVARADLLDDQVDDVLERVRAHLGARLATDPVALDLRFDPVPALPVGPARRARRHARDAVVAVTDALGLGPPTAHHAAERARGRVRHLVERLLAELYEGRIGSKVDARLALRGRGLAVLEGLLPGPVDLPVPPPVEHGPRARALGSLSGIEGAERLLRADAATWLADVQLAIADAYQEHPEWEERALQVQAHEEATARLLAALGQV